MLSATNEHFMLSVMLNVAMSSVVVPPGVNVIKLFFLIANDNAK
jgi:hypothetical protein